MSKIPKPASLEIPKSHKNEPSPIYKGASIVYVQGGGGPEIFKGAPLFLTPHQRGPGFFWAVVRGDQEKFWSSRRGDRIFFALHDKKFPQKGWKTPFFYMF